MIETKVPVLLVDDRPANLLSLEALLDSPGYELVKAQSGPEALDAVRERDFAVVLLDVVMPGMDGFATMRAMRALRRDATPMPVIFVTGLETSADDVTAAYASGAVDFVQKPLVPEVVRSKVAMFAELHRARTEAARQQQTEAALRASEQWTRHLIQAVTDYAIFTLDGTGHVATWNPGVQKIKGYARDELLGRHFSVFYTPEDVAAGRPEQLLETVRQTGRVEDESWRVRKDGSRFWANVVITALRDQKGTLIGFAKVTRDLTEKRLAQESRWKLLQEQNARAISEAERERLRTLLTQLPASVTFLRGRDLIVEFVNEQTVVNAGGRDIVGMPLHVAMPQLVEHYERIRGVFDTGQPYVQHEAVVWAELGGERRESYWDSVYLPLRDASGEVEGVMLFDLEVSANVRARQELERLNRAKDEFLAMLSHELRTPLNAILGWASLLQRRPRDEGTLDRGLETIERNAKTQTKLISDLLDVSRAITGKMRLSLAPVEIYPAIASAADVVRPAAEAKGVHLAVEVDPGIGTISADPDRLQQILWNLLTNAVRFTPRSGRVTLEATRSDEELVIRVRDTGAGIAPEHLPHIFERFVQVDSSATRRHGGLGLGLAIVRHLAEAHGGSVQATSEGVGQGATFQVAIPIIRALDEEEKARSDEG